MPTEPAIPRVICARCNRPVDRVAWWRDDEGRKTVIRAYCHGDIDTGEIDDAITVCLGPEAVVLPMVAFRVGRLEYAEAPTIRRPGAPTEDDPAMPAECKRCGSLPRPGRPCECQRDRDREETT